MLVRVGLVAALACSASMYAQGPGPGRGPRGFGPLDGNFGGNARFLGAEPGTPGRVVKNAPYSADVVTETTQILPDGNRIHQTSTSKVYRDSEGRTRREQSLRSLNGLAPNSNFPPVVFINDPVAHVNYALNSQDHTASKSTGSRGGQNPPPSRGQRRENSNVKTESLGHQTVEGVPADGTRTTMTIPAGQIGNEQPIQVVTETWYSPELQTTVMQKRTDPRSGETIFRVTNVSRAEPPANMFQVPAEYKINESSRPVRTAPKQ